MRLLVVLIMVTVIRAKDCPVTCECNDFPRDPLQNNNNVYTTVTCDSVVNTTDNIPTTTNKLILRDFSYLDIETFIENLTCNSALFPYLFHLGLTHCVIPNLLNVSFSGLERLQSLDLSRSELKHLPDPEIAFNLTSLKALDLSNNEIRVIESSPFRTLTSLEVLNLSANVIDTLAENSFSGLSKLQCLDISSNKLVTLHSDAFIPLNTLQHLNLSNNLLEVLDESCLSSLQRLQQLDVSWNRLAHVAPGSLQLPSLSRLLLAGNPALGGSREPALLVGPGKRLQTVDASRTGLKQVPAALTHSIRTLRLAGNSIRSVSCGHLDSYPLLQLLDFTSNDLEEIEDDALGRLELLSILYLSDNKLRSIPRDLPERLRILHLEHNQIEQILPGDLQGMPLLEVLLLSDNKVRVVREGAFSQLGALATLDLSRNPISILPAGTLSGPWQLQVLRLSNLNVISPAKEMAFPLPTPEHLVTLDLSASPGLSRQFLADTAALAASRELQELDLSGGNLEHIRSDLLHYLPQLRTLRLINNSLNCTELQWLAVWLRRQDQPESRKVTCSSPAELSGSLLIDLQNIESVSQLNYEITSTTTESYTEKTGLIRNENAFSVSLSNNKLKYVSSYNINFTITKSSFERNAKASSQFPDGISASSLALSPTKSNAMSDDDLSNKQNLTYIFTAPTPQITKPEAQQETFTKNNTATTKSAEDKTLVNPVSPSTSTRKEYAESSRPQNVNEPDNFFTNKPRRGSVRTEITQNLFIASKENSFNNEVPAAQYSDNINGSFSKVRNMETVTDEKTNSTEIRENATGTTGKMSMFTEPKSEKNLTHPGMLVLLAGILSAAAAMAMLASKFRKRRRNYQQQDIEVSSLPSVTELW
ncbi:hypothetical protein ILUMI_02823 [Ignelater luminosus]|uniref:Uncharacterized protein n=1 Tax=Ignelater luminosus TaxID=2038154 RepID=A0A8K0DFS4_IGNLU|nr:hypothetical protein ILUMI_02823 [Ignelater luminosus]